MFTGLKNLIIKTYKDYAYAKLEKSILQIDSKDIKTERLELINTNVWDLFLQNNYVGISTIDLYR